MKGKEFIICSAIDHDGLIICGRRHSDCYNILNVLTNDTLTTSETPQRDKQGFMTSLDRYVNRVEGWSIAKDNKQIQYGYEASDGENAALISENLY